MSVLIADRRQAQDYLKRRHVEGLDTYDEVWDGVTVIMPQPNDNHQDFVGSITGILKFIYDWKSPPFIRPGVNVSDRDFHWMENYRCPDVVVYHGNTKAVNHNTFWKGGPDFLIEVVSEDDQCRDKLPFYASVDTGEVLIIDRDPWQLELYRLNGRKMVEVGRSTLPDSNILACSTIPVTFRLVEGTDRPRIEIVHTANGQSWLV